MKTNRSSSNKANSIMKWITNAMATSAGSWLTGAISNFSETVFNETFHKPAYGIARGLLATSTLSALAISALSSSTAYAQLPVNQIQLGTPSYNGTGCPLGTVSATLSPDAQALSILFGAFQVDAGGSSGRTIDRKACQIAIPVHVPSGYSVSIIKIDYRGYKRLPYNASATFDVEYFFAGQNGPSYHKNFVGAEDGNFTLNNQLVATANVWSACGADVNLRTNTSIAAQTNQYNEQTMLTLDSADVSSGMIYQLSWRTCGSNGGGYPPTPNPFPGNGNGGGNGGGYPGVGPCVINSYYDSRGYQLFMIKDGMGRVVGNTVQYAEALRLAQQSQSMGFCSGIVNNSSQTNPQQPPYPGNNGGYGNGGYGNGGYPPRQTSCQVMPGRDAYGNTFFRVMDRAGRIILNTPNQSLAYQAAQSDPRCFQ